MVNAAAPVGKRTRLQRAIQERELRERSRRARLEARLKHRKENDIVISDNDEEDAVQVVDVEDYNRRFGVNNPPNVAVFNEENGFTAEFVGNQFGINEGYFEKGDIGSIPNNVNGEDSDDSLQVIGERWNPMIFGDYDDIDDDSDEDEIVIAVPNANGDGFGGGEDGEASGEIGLTSSEDDDDVVDKDFKVDEAGNYLSSESSSSLSESESDESDSDYEGVREHKKVVESEEDKERRRERRREEKRRKKNERASEEGNRVGVDGGVKNNVSKKKKENMTIDEMFESVCAIGAEEDDNVGKKKKTTTNSDSHRSKTLEKGSDGVFRKVVSSSHKEDTNVGELKDSNKPTPNRSGKFEKGSDGMFRKVESSSQNGDGNNSSNTNHSVKMKKGSDGVLRKVESSFKNEDGDDNVGVQMGSNNSDPNRSGKVKKESGGVSRKVGSANEDEDDDDDEPKKKVMRKEKVYQEGEGRGDESSERELSARSLNKRKRKEKAIEDDKIENALLDTILEEGLGGVEETMPTPEPTPKEYTYLPLKFTFPAKKAVPEKSEQDLETENLFKELELGLQACQIGSDDTPLNEDMDVDQPKSEVPEHMLCSGGKHHLIHDEEIGIYCRFCSYVMLESKHVTPDFSEDIFGVAGRKEAKKSQYDDKDGDDIQIPTSFESSGDHPEQSKIIQGTVWELIPGTWRTLFPHQREGFEFIWRNVAGGIKINEIEKPTDHGIGGCIICHAPGTGKTRLAIVFLQSFLKRYPMSRPVIVAPRTMLRTWQEEFLRWKVEVPFFNLNENELSGKEDKDVLNCVKKGRSTKNVRKVKMSSWVMGKGILGLSYGLYVKLASQSNKTERGIIETDKGMREALLNKPGLLVLDEGHTPRNEKSNIWKVISEVSTKRKVILSGTPFQNNFEELSNTLSLVREEFEVPIKTGVSNIHDDRKIEELSNKIRPFVHVHKGEILKQTLKGLFSSLIILNPSKVQEMCFAATDKKTNFAQDYQVSVSSVHPYILCDPKASFIDKEWEALLESHKDDLDAGVKARFLFELIKLSQGERVLVFGQYIASLNFLAGLIKSRFHWEMGRELLYMDGKLDTKERQNTIRLFNDPKSDARVLLASTRACSEGIHLVGGSRVVLLDVVWNPSVERQAISRAYRLGQKRDVFVYHLITSGTQEEQKYRRQATKERVAELVFSSSDGKCIKKSSSGSKIYADQVLDAMLDHDKLKTMFQRIVYQPKADNLIESFGPLNL